IRLHRGRLRELAVGLRGALHQGRQARNPRARHREGRGRRGTALPRGNAALRHMSQSRAESLLEASLNTASGFVVSLVVWHFVAAAYEIPMPLSTNLEITGIFTVVSVARSYAWRRFFNAGAKRLV